MPSACLFADEELCAWTWCALPSRLGNSSAQSNAPLMLHTDEIKKGKAAVRQWPVPGTVAETHQEVALQAVCSPACHAIVCAASPQVRKAASRCMQDLWNDDNLRLCRLLRTYIIFCQCPKHCPQPKHPARPAGV